MADWTVMLWLLSSLSLREGCCLINLEKYLHFIEILWSFLENAWNSFGSSQWVRESVNEKICVKITPNAWNLTGLQDVFKTSSRRLQDIFKTSCKDAFKLFWIIRLNCLPGSRICLGHTSEKFMVSVENLQVWYILA